MQQSCDTNAMRHATSTRVRGLLLPLLLVLAPVAIVYGVLYRYAISIPCLDDYNATLNFLLEQRLHPHTGGKVLAVIAFQHGEYKLLFEHALIGSWYALTGGFRFKVFILLGNLLLLPSLWVLWCLCFPSEPDRARRLLLFAPVVLLFFELDYAELLDWVMASLNGIAVVSFALLSLSLLARRSRLALGMACLFAALSCSASGNGFLLAPAGVVILWPARRLRRIALWLVPFAVMLPLYLYRYRPVPHPAAPQLWPKLLFLLSFVGGAIENIHGFPVRHAGFVLGAAVLLVVAHSIRTRFHQRSPVLAAIACWVLLSAALVAGVRSYLGVPQSLASRYKIYSVLLLIYCYLYLADRVLSSATGMALQRHRRAAFSVALAATLVFSISADVVGARFLARRHARLVEGMARYQADPEHVSPLYAPDDPEDFSAGEREAERKILTRSIAAGLYRPPPLPAATDHH